MNITFYNFSYTVKKKTILYNVEASINQNELVGILGSTGSGKSTLLELLTDSKKRTTGTLLFNGNEINSFNKRHIAYIKQEPILCNVMTIKETLNFYNKLINKKVVSYTEVLRYFGLYEQQNTQVVHLSGGQKKRLSIICGILSNPKIIFLDEPTSGLDSYYALETIKFLKNYSKEVITVLTIHQPNMEIWELFDKICILERGYQVYFGSRRNLNNSFKYHIDPLTTEVEFILDKLNNINYHNLINIASDYESSSNLNYDIVPYELPPLNKKVNIFMKFFLLLNRSSKFYTRSSKVLMTRIFIVFFIGLIELILLDSGEHIFILNTKNETIYNFMRLMCYILFKMFTVSLLPLASLGMLFEKKHIIENEIFMQYYNGPTYFLSNSIIETFVQILTAIIYSLITWFPSFKTQTLTNVYLLYAFVITLQMLVANSIVQFVSTVTSNRDIAMLVFSSYLSVSFLLIIGQNLHYKNAILQNISFLRYPINAILVDLNNKWITLLLKQININYQQVIKLGFTGNVMVSAGIFIVFNLLTVLALIFI